MSLERLRYHFINNKNWRTLIIADHLAEKDEANGCTGKTIFSLLMKKEKSAEINWLSIVVSNLKNNNIVVMPVARGYVLHLYLIKNYKLIWNVPNVNYIIIYTQNEHNKNK